MFGAETPKETINPAQETMNSVFEAGEKDKPDVEYKAEPFTEEELDQKVGKPRKELYGAEKAKLKDIIAQAKDAIKSNSRDGKVSHGDTQSFSIDDVLYVYLRDDSQKVAASKDRLFKRV